MPPEVVSHGLLFFQCPGGQLQDFDLTFPALPGLRLRYAVGHGLGAAGDQCQEMLQLWPGGVV